MRQPSDPQTNDESAGSSPPPSPDGPAQTNPASPSDESPDRDTPAWEGAEPDDAIGLIDPRPEIPTPPGL